MPSAHCWQLLQGREWCPLAMHVADKNANSTNSVAADEGFFGVQHSHGAFVIACTAKVDNMGILCIP